MKCDIGWEHISIWQERVSILWKVRSIFLVRIRVPVH